MASFTLSPKQAGQYPAGPAFSLALYDLSSSGSVTASFPGYVCVDSAGTLINPATNEKVQGVIDALAATLKVQVTAGGGALTLPTGASSETTLAAVLAKITASAATEATMASMRDAIVADVQNAPFSHAVPLSSSASPAGRSVGIACTTDGAVTLTLSSGDTIQLPVSAGWQTFPFAATRGSFSAGSGSLFNLS